MEINIIDTIIHLSDICYSLNEDTLKHENLSRSESFILLSLNPGEQIAGNELATRNRLSPSRVSRIVEHMVEKGLLTRTEAAGDRRFINLSLSDEGIKKHSILMKFKKQCEDKIRSQLDESQFKVVNSGLSILTSAMEK